MKRYQWLLFDADNTLFDFERAETTALDRAFQSIGVTLAPGQHDTYRRINQALWLSVEKGENKPAFLKLRRFELLLEAIGVAYPAEKLSAIYLECLAECSQLLPDAAEVIQVLQQNHRIAILTNGLQVVQRGRLARSVIRPHIAEIIISEEIGHAKPAKEFFDIALARLGQPSPRDALMIGDNWTSDITGAINYGLDACWYNPKRNPRPGPHPLTREIASLRELVDWLQ